jgi:uncharacterized oligopeptide transporter (OPT) family protein
MRLVARRRGGRRSGSEAAEEASISGDFTLRAALAGLGLGAVLTIGNVYMGLKTGWWDSGNITAAVLGFALVAPLARRGPRPYSLFENNITQTLAGSAAVMPATLGLLGGLPALELLGRSYPAWAIGAWGLALGVFGILLGVPFRQRFVVSDPLPFPSAIATAEVLRAVQASSAEARARTRALAAGAVFAMAVTWFRDAWPSLLPGSLFFPFAIAGASAESLTLGVAVSPMLASVGMLIGARSGMSLLFGSIAAWGILGPMLVRAGIAKAEYTSLVEWLLWPGIALMVSSGLVGLALRWRSFGRAVSDVRELRAGTGERAGWVALVAAGCVVTALTWSIFGVHPALGAIVVIVSVVLIDVCVRTAGETDIAPLGPVGQLGQLLLALVGPVAAPVNVACASIAANAGGQASLTVNVLKAGHVLGAPVRGQLRAQLAGAFAGVLVALPAYTFFRDAHGIGTAAFPAPAARAWKAMAELAEHGTASLPPWAAQASLLGAAIGVVLALLERTKAARFVPSPVALAVAFLVPGTTGVTIALGTLAWIVLERQRPTAAERFASSLGAGGIAGEALMGFVIAALVALGILPGR